MGKHRLGLGVGFTSGLVVVVTRGAVPIDRRGGVVGMPDVRLLTAAVVLPRDEAAVLHASLLNLDAFFVGEKVEHNGHKDRSVEGQGQGVVEDFDGKGHRRAFRDVDDLLGGVILNRFNPSDLRLRRAVRDAVRGSGTLFLGSHSHHHHWVHTDRLNKRLRIVKNYFTMTAGVSAAS